LTGKEFPPLGAGSACGSTGTRRSGVVHRRAARPPKPCGAGCETATPPRRAARSPECSWGPRPGTPCPVRGPASRALTRPLPFPPRSRCPPFCSPFRPLTPVLASGLAEARDRVPSSPVRGAPPWFRTPRAARGPAGTVTRSGHAPPILGPTGSHPGLPCWTNAARNSSSPAADEPVGSAVPPPRSSGTTDLFSP